MSHQLTTTGPDILTAIARAPLAESTRRKYTGAIERARAAGVQLLDAAALADYAADLPTSGRAFLKAAIRLWSNDIADRAKAGADPSNVAAVQATIYRIEALQNAVKVAAATGQKFHTWLTQSQVKALIRATSSERDRLTLALLVGAGLRRSEAATIDFKAMVSQDKRTVLNVMGKGSKTRTVPVSGDLAAMLNDWRERVGDGPILRSITRGGAIGDGLSDVAIFHIVRTAGQRIDRPDLAPHDLRRTYAQLGFEAGVPITQISRLLGHASVATTQRYLNSDLDLETSVSDFVPLG